MGSDLTAPHGVPMSHWQGRGRGLGARRQLPRPLVLRRRRRRQGDAAATVINSTTSSPPPLHLLVVLHERVDAAAAAAANAAAADAGCSMDEQHTLNEGNIFPNRTSIFTSVLICPRWVVRVAQAYPYVQKKQLLEKAKGTQTGGALHAGCRAACVPTMRGRLSVADLFQCRRSAMG